MGENFFSYVSRIVKNSIFDSKDLPDSIHIKLTNRCNLTCRMCDIWKQQNREELPVEQWKLIIRKLYKWKGPFRIDFAGGEIFLFKDFLKLIRFCKQLECHTVVTTNGVLIDEITAKEIVDAGIGAINFSLDTLDPGLYLYLRKTDAIKKIFKTLSEIKKMRLKEYNPTLCIACIIMSQNVDELTELIRWVEDGNGDIINFQVIDNNFNSKYDSNWFKKSNFWPKNTEKVLSTIDRIIEMKNIGYPINNSVEQLQFFKKYFEDPKDFVKTNVCRTGEKNFIIDTDGSVLLCWNMLSIGNVLYNDPASIWNGRIGYKRREDIVKCNRTCKILNCNY